MSKMAKKKKNVNQTRVTEGLVAYIIDIKKKKNLINKEKKLKKKMIQTSQLYEK